ncbi:hypothetical protein EVG20_g5042 [Dentipellis fragilis]|uniref:Cytochrome P450 n=1 Tax=Dentipellis fragilis TaxID=205917 RepID=A0A4Y9YWJ4_9AGAM|nr:hypothetical protein EVG20_g5042 [Dentipellis fragilis]
MGCLTRQEILLRSNGFEMHPASMLCALVHRQNARCGRVATRVGSAATSGRGMTWVAIFQCHKAPAFVYIVTLFGSESIARASSSQNDWELEKRAIAYAQRHASRIADQTTFHLLPICVPERSLIEEYLPCVSSVNHLSIRLELIDCSAFACSCLSLAPEEMTSSDAFVLALAILVVTLVVSSIRRRWALPAPPGPPSLPILGNFLSLPAQQQWVIFSNWSKALQSDLISVRSFGQLTLVINSRKVVKELCGLSIAFTYSPRVTQYRDLTDLRVVLFRTGWDFNTGLIPYSEKWRARCRLLHATLHERAAQRYRPLQRVKVHELLCSLHSSPENFESHISRLAGAIAIAVAYGDIGGKRQIDEFIHQAREAAETLSKTIWPHSITLNALPFLRHFPGWLPGFGFQGLARRRRELIADMQNVPWAIVEQGMAENTATPSMASKMIDNLEKTKIGPDSLQAAKDACAITFVAGADTTSSAMTTAVLCLLRHPEIQHRAQQEIDQVVGHHRLPTYEDRSSLPYVEAIYREALRWHPVLPLSVARAALEDDIYDGYFIPKGTILTANVCLCSGHHLADATVWMAIASVLAIFRLVPAKDEYGNEVPVRVEYTSGLVSHPLPFKCAFEPRDEEARVLLAQLQDQEAMEQLSL